MEFGSSNGGEGGEHSGVGLVEKSKTIWDREDIFDGREACDTGHKTYIY